MSNRKRVRTSTVLELRTAVESLAPKGSVAESDVDGIARLCAMGALPDGDEDPRGILSGISDETVKRIAARRPAKNSIASRVVQFFVVEWCLRKGHLKEWMWAWETPSAGRMSYRPAIPIRRLMEMASSG